MSKNVVKQNFFIEYSGIATDQFKKRLKSIEAPVQPVITLRKMITFLPSLKSKIEKNLQIQEVYKIVRPGCNGCFFVQANRHQLTRFKNSRYTRNKPVLAHFDKYTYPTPTLNNVKIFVSTSHILSFFITLQALYKRELKHELNTKDKYGSRKLAIKF